MASKSRHAEEPPVQDVTIPAQLLRAAANTSSVRDSRTSVSWRLQSVVSDRSEGSQGCSTQHDQVGSPQGLTKPTPALRMGPVKERNPSRYQSGLEEGTYGQESISSGGLEHRSPSLCQTSSTEVDPKDVSDARRSTSIVSGVRGGHHLWRWSTTNPFSRHHDEKEDTGRGSNRQSLPHNSFDLGQRTSHSFGRQRPRRGTVATIVDAIVPETIQKTLANIPPFRQGSIWHTYESAKKRTNELKRSTWVQLIFELSMYAIILLFVYFVLIGVPLWKGAVYWIWYLEAHQFVVQGGVSVTLGIAMM